MHLFGLTGGIASGKSTVAAMFRALGAPVLDADAIYHGLIMPLAQGTPSDLVKRIEAAFPGVVLASGELDRAALGARVFADPEARQRLNAIAHPEVARVTAEGAQRLAGEGHRLALYDVPLLYERGLEASMAGVVVVWVPREVQIARLCGRDGVDVDTAEQRLVSQMPLDEKRQRADWVVDNSGTLVETESQVRAVWAALQQRAGVE